MDARNHQPNEDDHGLDAKEKTVTREFHHMAELNDDMALQSLLTLMKPEAATLKPKPTEMINKLQKIEVDVNTRCIEELKHETVNIEDKAIEEQGLEGIAMECRAVADKYRRSKVFDVGDPVGANNKCKPTGSSMLFFFILASFVHQKRS